MKTAGKEWIIVIKQEPEGMKKEVLVVLGSSNSPRGVLSDISLSRLDCCRNIFAKGQLILCTGGWGPHFNISDKAHAFYAKEYLLENGLSEKDFLEFALSENTVDDAVKLRSILSNPKDIKLKVITSDYHLERVILIFNEILDKYEMDFMGVESKMEAEKLCQLIEHENNAIVTIKQKGLYYNI